MAKSQIVVFMLAGQEYSMDIMKVLEISPYQAGSAVPEVPSYIEGIINLRGTIYPIFNLRKRLRMPEAEVDDKTKIIIMNLDKINVGFIVDSVQEIMTVEEDDIDPTPEMLKRYESRYIKGITKKDDRIIIILDVDLLLSEDDQNILDNIVN